MASFHKQFAPFLFGVGAVAQLAERLTGFGSKKPLIITDKGVAGSGALDKAVASLKENGISYVVYDETLPDAPQTGVYAAIDLARKENADAVVAVGGGSIMDTAKAVSALIKESVVFSADPPSPDSPPPAPNTPDVPLILIPTTCGTGSEETAVAVLSMADSHAKFGFVLTGGALSIVDPELTLGLPPYLTATTGMDVVSHACEAYTTVMMKNPVSDQRALAAMRLAAKWLPIAVKDGSNIEARTNMSLACTLAGMAFNDSMNNFGHGIAHAFGTSKHLAHGLACALAEPAALESFAPEFPELIRDIGIQFGADIPATATPEEIGKATGNQLRALMKEIDIPSFEKLGIERDDVISHVDKVLGEMQTNLAPIKVTPEIAKAVLTSMYDDYR